MVDVRLLAGSILCGALTYYCLQQYEAQSQEPPSSSSEESDVNKVSIGLPSESSSGRQEPLQAAEPQFSQTSKGSSSSSSPDSTSSGGPSASTSSSSVSSSSVGVLGPGSGGDGSVEGVPS